MGRKSELVRFIDLGMYIERGWGRQKGYLNRRWSSSPYKQEVNFGTSSSKQVYTYTAVKDVILEKGQKTYGCEVISSLRYLEKYGMESERPTRIMSLKTDPNTKETYQIGLDMLY